MPKNELSRNGSSIDRSRCNFFPTTSSVGFVLSTSRDVTWIGTCWETSSSNHSVSGISSSSSSLPPLKALQFSCSILDSCTVKFLLPLIHFYSSSLTRPTRIPELEGEKTPRRRSHWSNNRSCNSSSPLGALWTKDWIELNWKRSSNFPLALWPLTIRGSSHLVPPPFAEMGTPAAEEEEEPPVGSITARVGNWHGKWRCYGA